MYLMNYDHRSWAVHAGSSYDFDKHAPHIDNGSARPAPVRYTSQEFFDRAWEKVFTKTWLLAGPASDVREPGDWMKFDIGPASFIVVRGDNGGLHAHYHVCPHPGSQLVRDDMGSSEASRGGKAWHNLSKS